MISKRLLFYLILSLIPLAAAACSDMSSTLGQYHQGRILMLNVFEIERSDEIRYSNPDTQKWRIRPSEEGYELLLMRIRIENHVAMNTVLVADQQAAVIEGFFQDEFRPISVHDTVFLDKRGPSDTTITLNGGQCTDHPRVVVTERATVQWINAGDSDSFIQFDDDVTTLLGNNLLQIMPGESVSTQFDQPGTFGYQCSGDDGDIQSAQVLVEDKSSVRVEEEKEIEFLEGSFELHKGFSLDGWMIFDVPKDTEIKSLRWRAGDSITIRF